MKSATVHSLFVDDIVEYALYGWGPSISGIGPNIKSKEKMIPHAIVGFDKKVRSLEVGNDHCAAITGITTNILL